MPTQISAADVNKLRQQTGAGMMDCKEALTAANGNFEAAVDYLRKKGAKVAANRQDRDSKEGVVIAKVSANGKEGVIVEVNCETDFVAKNADFIKFAQTVAQIAIDNMPKSLEDLNQYTIEGKKIADHVIQQTGVIGEKIAISKLETLQGERVVAYIHGPYRLGVLVAFSENTLEAESIGKEIAMQIAAMSPIAVDKNQIPTTLIDREIEIAKAQARAEGKPDNMLEKIALGKLNKFYKDASLLSQDYIKDASKTVAQFLESEGKGLNVTGFKRIQLGA